MCADKVEYNSIKSVFARSAGNNIVVSSEQFFYVKIHSEYHCWYMSNIQTGIDIGVDKQIIIRVTLNGNHPRNVLNRSVWIRGRGDEGECL